MGGLSLGYWIFGALTRSLVLRGQRSGRPAPLLVVYGAFVASMQRQRGPLFIRRMRALGEGGVEQPQRRIPLNAAVDLTRLFIEEYAHAAPLDPGALLGAWKRCGKNPTGVELCRPGLHAAQRLMIGDPPPDPDDWLNPAAEVAATAHAAPAEGPEERGDDDEL